MGARVDAPPAEHGNATGHISVAQALARVNADARRTTSAVTRRLRQEVLAAYLAWLPRFRLVNFAARLLPPTSLSTVRAVLYRGAGFNIGPRVSFLSAVTIIGAGQETYRRLTIGEGSLIGLNPTFNLDDTITLGRNVSLGPRVSIYTSSHLLGPASCRMNPRVITRPVAIEDGAWIGVNSVILPGVVIGRGSVVSAGSVVTDSVPPNMLVAGNPAKLVQELPSFEG